MKNTLYFIGNHAVFYLMIVFAVPIIASIIMVPLVMIKRHLPRNSIFFINDLIVLFILITLLFGHLDSFIRFFNYQPNATMYFLIGITLLIFIRQTKDSNKENHLVSWQHRNFKIRLLIVSFVFSLMFFVPVIYRNFVVLALPDLFLKLSEYKIFIYFSLLAGFAMVSYYLTEIYRMIKTDIN
jgi:hypothetical protein